VETPTKLVSRSRKTRPTIRGKKGVIIYSYIAPPPRTRVICIDEMGPVSAKTYPGETWEKGPYRATFEPDYGTMVVVARYGSMELLSQLQEKLLWY